MPRKEKTLSSVLKALASALDGPSDLDELRPLEQLILLILCHESDVRKARTGMGRLQSHYVDWNEVRVTGVYEIASHLKTLVGQKKALTKANRLRDLLSTVYNRFNKLNLDFLHASGADPELGHKQERFLTYLQAMLRKVKAEAAKARREAAKNKAAKAKKKRTRKKTTAKGKKAVTRKKVKKPVAKKKSKVAQKKAGKARMKTSKSRTRR